jgi:drug/metabolite transporter (DMT)-like permease
MKPKSRAYLQLHWAIFLFGFTAILGDLISLSAVTLVWWRMLFTCVSIVFILNLRKHLKELPKGMIRRYMGIGLLVGIHWITFFGSIKLANASVALVCMATSAFFTAIMEPLITHDQRKSHEIILGLAVIPGMVLVVNGIDQVMMNGVWVGLLSAILAAAFSSYNKRYIADANPVLITFLELGSGWLLIGFLLLGVTVSSDSFMFWPSRTDLIYLLLLSLVCTTWGYVLALKALRQLSAFSTVMAINLEPVYGIILAFFILKEGEELTLQFYIGVAVIILAIFIHPFIRSKEKVSSHG